MGLLFKDGAGMCGAEGELLFTVAFALAATCSAETSGGGAPLTSLSIGSLIGAGQMVRKENLFFNFSLQSKMAVGILNVSFALVAIGPKKRWEMKTLSFETHHDGSEPQSRMFCSRQTTKLVLVRR